MADKKFEPKGEPGEPLFPKKQPIHDPEVERYKIERFQKKLKEEQNLPLAAVAGLAAAVIGAILWAVVTVLTEYQIGWMAIGVGFLVGFAVRYFGKGMDQVFGIIGAGISLFGILLGNFLSAVAFISQFEAVPFLDVVFFLLTAPGVTIELMIAAFSPIDLLFYGLAIYQGYKLSFRLVTKKELETALNSPY